ncbi:MAG: zinc-binding dehydrogenase [Rhodospirillaceae bacterium]|nr:zinc-binding dehydrogenase [Rhodospirillaceae bacterium]MBT5047229.1 zinc-binding dehydrogenase [Rhodospirillaceae bacterium]MBT6427318.1 zinc-binding dehydrogenase [Rhodospirillaceae bacterium]MBT7755925.1 zinc-binding dehydrogenase [Rhodospirillaceae bacterium]
MSLEDAPEPEPGLGEVLIEVAFAGCNWADTQVRSGIYPHPYDFPVIPGMEVSGIVLGLGAGVDNLAVGDRVTALSNMGGYAEKCVAEATLVTKLPDTVGLDVGAAFPVQALTAFHMLYTVYNLKKDDVVLVHAAGGGVGLLVIQMVVNAGARVIGTVGTEGKGKMALHYGAERVVNLKQEDFVTVVNQITQGRGVDLVIDSLGAETLDRSFDAVKVLGHVINIGEAQGKPFGNIRDRVLPTSSSFTRFSISHVMPNALLWQRGMDFVLQALAENWLEIPIVQSIPMDKVRDMHRQIEGRQVAGKLLLEIAGER